MYREMEITDIPAVLPLYIQYYNTQEEAQWTPETAGRRIRQVLSMDGGYGLLLEEDGEAAGFVMGFFKQYDDLVSFNLEEIVIEHSRQGRGLGSALLKETERRVKERGAAGIELCAVNDEAHRCFYGRAGYGDAKNFQLKVKWFS